MPASPLTILPSASPARWRRIAGNDWTGPLAVTLLAGLLRFWYLGSPRAVVFDETYYAKDAWSLLQYGYEGSWADDADTRLLAHPAHLALSRAPEFVAHPPAGKWLIALGEAAFGMNPFGWRFVPALLGTLSVLLLCRVARRLLGSTALGCLAGLLLTADGLHLVMSRTALLDIVLMFWVLAGFGCLLLARDANCARRAWWWRLAAGVCLGLACGTKWSGGYYLAAFTVLALVWERAAGRAALLGRAVQLNAAAAVAYLACWSGWLATRGGWDRQRAAFPLLGLWHYHQQIWNFGIHLTDPHRYQSDPAGWLLLTRPVSYYFRTVGPGTAGCRAAACNREVLALGTPLLWWSATAALGYLGYRALRHRDGRAGAVLCAVGAGYLPWFLYQGRTLFSFYSVVFVPYLCLALAVLVQDLLRRPSRLRIVATGLVLTAIATNFVYFLPLYTGHPIATTAWDARIWFDAWV
ncbi:dolichyl-phosphate-mannose--protein mannosyltransferase [Kitasatospora sp. LaBMicrA B282]|uniref:dolichyl-phosphate-mannose--protein mannosyltransferase n=1 Tax=Kitasatospora sp. LaBMicrA B282 TaxID=3420949 RepID=UPI003D0C91F0